MGLHKKSQKYARHRCPVTDGGPNAGGAYMPKLSYKIHFSLIFLISQKGTIFQSVSSLSLLGVAIPVKEE